MTNVIRRRRLDAFSHPCSFREILRILIDMFGFKFMTVIKEIAKKFTWDVESLNIDIIRTKICKHIIFCISPNFVIHLSGKIQFFTSANLSLRKHNKFMLISEIHFYLNLFIRIHFISCIIPRNTLRKLGKNTNTHTKSISFLIFGQINHLKAAS